MKVTDFQLMKQQNKKIAIVTCYDFTAASIVEQSDIDCALVGDSLAMTMHGHQSTLPATLELMCLHIQAVAKAITSKFIIGDMPFLSYRKGLAKSMTAVEKILQAGAHAIKLEGSVGNAELISHIVHSGVPVMGHLGLTPQSIHTLGGFRVQGKNDAAAENILQQALTLEKAGCFAVVLECIPALLAQQITAQLTIPTIGIGAGPYVDGQVMVFQDLLGMNPNFKPKFVKHFCNGFKTIQIALNDYSREVKENNFPENSHSYA